MLRLSKTRLGADTFHMEVAPGFNVDQEGIPLVAYNIGGKTYAAPCQGTAGERFLGFSLSRATLVDRATTVQQLEVPANAPYEIELGLALIADQITVTAGGASLDVVTTAPNAGEVQIKGTRLIFNSAQAGVVVELHAAYVPTLQQALSLQGDSPAGGPIVNSVGVVGIIRSGTVYTDRYDVTAEFDSGSTDPVKLRTGANGLLTVGGSGADISGKVEFLEAPSVGAGFLGVRCGA